MNINIIFSLLLAHVIGDFYCQTDVSCKGKREKHLRSKGLYLHSAVIALLSWLMAFSGAFWWCFLILLVSHIIIDLFKSYLNDGLHVFLLDQVLHFAVIVLIATLYTDTGSFGLLCGLKVRGFSLLVLLLAVLLLFKPTNILIKLILERYKIQATNDGTSQQQAHAGALIGNLERLLTLCFVIIGQYEAIGFVIAAKSLLRFKDSDTTKTEYVLAGTLLSFGSAVFVGLLLLVYHHA